MAGMRKNHSSSIKTKVALAALGGQKTPAQLSCEFGVHSQQIKAWKEQALEAISERFGRKRGRRNEPKESDLYEEIGRLKVELDFLSSRLGR